MNRPYSFKELRQLKKEIVYAVLVIEKGSKSLGFLDSKIRGAASSYGTSSAFHKVVKNCLSGNDSINTVADEIKNLAALIEKRKACVSSVNKCSEYLKKNKTDIMDHVAIITSGSNSIKWFFLFPSKKEAVNKSYEYLSDVLSSPELERVVTLSKTITDTINNDIDISNDVSEYKTALFSIAGKQLQDTPLERSVEALINSYRDIFSKVNSIDSLIAEKELVVKTAVDKYMTYLAMQEMKSVPIEKLNDGKRGFRIKTLKDHRINTIYDYFRFPKHEMYDWKFLSYEMVNEMDKVATGYLNATKKMLHISLSVDAKSNFATNVVTAVCSLRQIIGYKKEIKAFNKQYDDWIDRSINNLETNGNGVGLAFSKDNEKEEFRKSYFFLKDTLESGYRKTIIDLVNKAKNRTQLNVNQAWDDFAEHSIEYYNIIERLCPNVLGSGDAKSVYGLPDFLAKEIESTELKLDGLKCELRRYQEWGVKYIVHQKRCLLGDEMGLGKTIQAIATMVHLKNNGETHFLVVCPASVLTNWYREVIKHSELSPCRIHGKYSRYLANQWVKNGGVAITTYECTKYIKLESSFRIGLLTVDEAHYIKNPEAIKTGHVKRISTYAKNLLFMTGTALENRVDEMVEIISILREDIGVKARQFKFMSDAPKFREVVAPVYYRRRREDVLSELPELLENEEWCDMNEVEEKAYADAIFSKNYMNVRRVSWNVEDLSYSTKAKRMLELIDEAADEGRKIIVFSYFLDTLQKVKGLLRDRSVDIINGSVPPAKRQEIIDVFDRSLPGTVLPAQIVSGGTGLNIQSASVVIICEPQFKPSIENQAISRAYRMGQARNVLVFRLLSDDTVDEHITNILQNKQQIFDEFADKSKASEGIQEIDDRTISEVVKLEEKRLREKGYTPSESFKPDNISTNESDYLGLLKKSYKEIIEYLLKLHGPALYDYFSNETCKSKNAKVSRSSEGLYCHHIDEDKAINLSNTYYALKNPYSYQKADRLVYCDILEHLVLHIKIVEEADDENLGLGGIVNFMCPQINDCLDGRSFRYEYQIKTQYIVQTHFNEYIELLKYFINLIKMKRPNVANGLIQYLYLNSDGKKVEPVYEALKKVV